jgi:hypothetical protein
MPTVQFKQYFFSVSTNANMDTDEMNSERQIHQQALIRKNVSAVPGVACIYNFALSGQSCNILIT